MIEQGQLSIDLITNMLKEFSAKTELYAQANRYAEDSGIKITNENTIPILTLIKAEYIEREDLTYSQKADIILSIDKIISIVNTRH